MEGLSGRITQKEKETTMSMHNNKNWSPVVFAIAFVCAWTSTVSAQENKGPPPSDKNQKQPTAADFIARLDKDGDGKVSKAEFDGPAEHFTASDKNKDGYISVDEVPSGPPPRKQGEKRGK